MTYWQEYRRCFHGPLAWTMWLVLIEIVIFCGVIVWTLIGLFDAGTTRGLVLHATFFIASVLAVIALKTWVFSLMHRYALEDRLRRLEALLEGHAQGDA